MFGQSDIADGPSRVSHSVIRIASFNPSDVAGGDPMVIGMAGNGFETIFNGLERLVEFLDGIFA